MQVEASKIRKEFSSYLRMVKGSRGIIITRHGKPQAKLISLVQNEESSDDISPFFGMWSKKKTEGVKTVNKMRRRGRF